jgi:opacity protein-like surface antigen
MRRIRLVRSLGFACVLALLPLSRIGAEDTKGKWQFGFGLSYFATTDYIRSNSDIALSGGVVGEGGLPPVNSVDERPDVNMLNEPSVRDDSRFDLNASYGLTRWLAVELAASYLKAPVGNIEFFTKNEIANLTGSGNMSNSPPICGPAQNQPCFIYGTSTPTVERTNAFVPVGELTEIPVQLSALVRFRPESPLDPYVGLGIGYIKTNLDTSAEFRSVSDTLGRLFVSSGDKGDFTSETSSPTHPVPSFNCGPDRNQQCISFRPSPPRAEVRDSFQWHAVSGIDYYVSERFSWYVDARYVWTNGAVDIRTDGDYQVQFSVTDEGQLVLKHIGGCPASDPNCGILESPGNYSRVEDLKYINSGGTEGTEYFLWEDTGFATCPGCCPACLGDRYYATEDKFGGNQPGDTPKQNRALEQVEDDGVLYILPPGSRDLAEYVEIWDENHPNFCAGCRGNGRLETEDRNGNTFMDTYLLYGLDSCTTDDWRSNPKCTARTSQTPSYVYPEGCAQTLARTQIDPVNLKALVNVGCPGFGNPSPGQPAETSTLTSADNVGDVYLLQGGSIRLGGFSLGVGVKFTF